MKRVLVLPAGTTHVLFGDLAHLIADALWPESIDPERNRYAGARVNLDDELARAVRSKRLRVKDPLSLDDHTFPFGEALNRGVVPVEELQSYVSERGLLVEVEQTEQEPPPPVKPVQRRVAHAERILSELRRMSVDPMQMPKYKNGHPSIKADVRKAISRAIPQAAFDKAWQDLLNEQRIQWAK